MVEVFVVSLRKAADFSCSFFAPQIIGVSPPQALGSTKPMRAPTTATTRSLGSPPLDSPSSARSPVLLMLAIGWRSEGLSLA